MSSPLTPFFRVKSGREQENEMERGPSSHCLVILISLPPGLNLNLLLERNDSRLSLRPFRILWGREERTRGGRSSEGLSNRRRLGTAMCGIRRVRVRRVGGRPRGVGGVELSEQKESVEEVEENVKKDENLDDAHADAASPATADVRGRRARRETRDDPREAAAAVTPPPPLPVPERLPSPRSVAPRRR